MENDLGRTACGKYCLNTVYNGKTLFEHACELDEFLRETNEETKKWAPVVITKNYHKSWNVNQNICRMMAVIENIEKIKEESFSAEPGDKFKQLVVDIVHKGGSDCVMFWEKNKPWTTGCYRRPACFRQHGEWQKKVNEAEKSSCPELKTEIYARIGGYVLTRMESLC